MQPTLHRLSDDTPVLVRLFRPEDREAVLEAFSRLSPDSRYYRFWSSHPIVQEQLLERFLNPKPGIHETWAAQDPERPDEPGYGAGSFFRSDADKEKAEISFTIADDAQSKGVGTLLLARIWTRARASGIKIFTGSILYDNFRTLDWVRQLGAKMKLQGACYSFTLNIESLPPKKNLACEALKKRIGEFETS